MAQLMKISTVKKQKTEKMSNSVLKQYFIKLFDQENPDLSDTTVACNKCFQHGITKRFGIDEENNQSDHLFEFHAIICNRSSDYVLQGDLLETSNEANESHAETESSQMQYADVVEVEFVQQANEGEEPIQETVSHGKEVVRHSGVWNYFEEQPFEQKVYCLLCRQSSVIHSYSTNSSTSNLRKHLRSAHEIEVENYRPLIKREKNEERRGYGMSRVWKYFCKITKNGEIQEKDYVYCAECLKTGVQHKYKQTSSTGTLKAHLNSVHHLSIDSGREYCSQPNVPEYDTIETIVGTELEATPMTVHRKGKPKKSSTARSFYHEVVDDDDFIQCSPCFAENKNHRYRKSTSSTTLKAHLVQKHSIDPDADDLPENLKDFVEEGEVLSEPVIVFEPEIIERAERICAIKTRKVRTYFIRLHDEEAFCCTFCIVDGIKKSYKPTTSTSGLRRHLVSAHEMDPIGYFRGGPSSDIVLNEEQLAESIAGTNKAKESDVWKYFCRKEVVKDDSSVGLDEDHIYCSLCWNAPVRQIHKYKNSTSSGALKRHLAARHGKVIEKRRQRVSSKPTDLNVSTDRENEFIVEEVNIIQEPTRELPPSSTPKVKPPKYCRSCGKKDAGFFTKLSAIFDDADSNEFEHSVTISLADLFYEVTGIRVSDDDGMSQLICYLCEANLKLSYKFRKTALETEAAMLEKMNLEEQEEMDDEYEALDEAYLEVEQAAASIKRQRLDSKLIFQSQKSSGEKTQKPKILTVMPKYKKIKQERETPVVVYHEQESGEDEAEMVEYEGYEVQIEQDESQELDIIEDESEQVTRKRNYDDVLWSDDLKKGGVHEGKRKISGS